jgi:hypothetical protein
MVPGSHLALTTQCTSAAQLFRTWLPALSLTLSCRSISFHYHSNFDNEYWMEKYGDPGFVRHVTASKILGLALLRLSDSLVLPLNITQYASELSDYRDSSFFFRPLYLRFPLYFQCRV